MSLRYSIRHLLLSCLAVTSSDCLAKSDRPISLSSVGVTIFKVTETSGDVKIARPLSAEFLPAYQGLIVPDGSLLRVAENSSISIEAEDNLRREGFGIKKTRIQIRVPIVLRLGRESFRRISMDPRLVSQYSSKVRRPVEDSEIALRKMSDAWRQMAAMLSPDNGMDEEMIKQIIKALNKGRKQEDVGISVLQGKIDFVTPNDRQLLLTDNLPTGVRLMWQKEKAPALDLSKYDIYFWKQGETRTKYGQSQGNKYSVVVEKPGTYYMQVQSSDGLYRSKVRVVQIDLGKEVLKDKAKFSDKSRDEAIKATLSRRIRALAPDRNLLWYGDGKWPIFEFEWSRPDICSQNVVYEFVVTDKDEKEVYKRTLNKQKHQWRPPRDFVGTLFWQSRVIGCMAADKQSIRLEVNTLPRRIRFFKLASGKSEFSRIGQSRFNGTLFFNSF